MTISESVVKTEKALIEFKYSPWTLKTHQGVWRKFKKYAGEKEVTEYSPQIADDFMRDIYNFPQVYYDGCMSNMVRDRVRAIRLLKHYVETGEIVSKLLLPSLPCPDCFEPIHSEFCEFIKQSERGERSVMYYSVNSREFLRFAFENDCKSYTAISKTVVDKYIDVVCAKYAKATLAIIFRSLRHFFGFILEKNVVAEDFSKRLPQLRIFSDGHIPATITEGQLQQLLSGIDIGNPTGMRDYAVIMIAAELGIRGGDICTMKFDNFDWENRILRFIQEKTGVPQELPLPENSFNAIVNYLKNGRPKIKSPYVFLKHSAPYPPFSGAYDSMQRALRSAGIRLTETSPKGLHLLRHTRATSLLEHGTEPAVVTGILGHEDPNSTEVYYHSSKELLRRCALDPEELFMNG